MKVLLVDDEVLALRALEKRVDWGKYGFTDVFAVQNAAAAKTLLAEHKVDLTLCDIEMPGENGLALAEYIRSNHPNTACIMVTCHADFGYAQRGIRSKVLDYLLKPIDYEELDALLTRFAAQRKAAADEGELAAGAANAQMARVTDYIEAHLREKIYLAELAELVHFSEQHLMRMFKRVYGKSVTEYITQRRIARACELLQSGEGPVRWISDQVGFENVSYFTKIFKQTTGRTPKAYRDSFRQK